MPFLILCLWEHDPELPSVHPSPKRLLGEWDGGVGASQLGAICVYMARTVHTIMLLCDL